MKCLNNNINIIAIENHRRAYAENYFDAGETGLQLPGIYKVAFEKSGKVNA